MVNANLKYETVYNLSGQFDYSKIGEQLILIGDILESFKLDRYTLKKIIFCSIEMMENIYRHSVHKKVDSAQYSFSNEFKIERGNEGFRIFSGNFVHNSEIEDITSYLQELKETSNSEIRKKYYEKLTDGPFSKKGGAGIGLLEVVKISKNPIDFNIEKIDDNFSYLRLYAFI